MENASDAIVMAGAMLIFVIALTVAMTVFSTARETVDAVVYASDETNYYLYIDTSTSSSSGIKYRIVGLETIIPTLYKYYKEDYTVVFLDEEGNGLKLYQSNTNALSWSGNTTRTEADIPAIASKYPGMSTEKKKTGNWICSFDLNEEESRGENFSGSNEDVKEFLDAFLSGGVYYDSRATGNVVCYDFSDNGFIDNYSDCQFKETIGTYSTDTSTSLSTTLNEGVRNTSTKRVIVYQLIDNNV